MIMNKYLELKMKQSKEFRKLPMKVAFGKKQFKEIMKECGLTTSKEDLTKIHQLGAGCYCLKKDYPLFLKLACKHMEEDVEFFKDDKNFKEALCYEFGNHECMITLKPHDAIEALSLTEEEIINNKRLSKLFKEAWKEFLSDNK